MILKETATFKSTIQGEGLATFLAGVHVGSNTEIDMRSDGNIFLDGRINAIGGAIFGSNSEVIIEPNGNTFQVGNLVVGTAPDQVKLLAATGSIEADGTALVKEGITVGISNQILLNPDGTAVFSGTLEVGTSNQIVLNPDGTSVFSGTLKVGTSNQIVLNPDGTATITDLLTTKNGISVGASNQIKLNPDGTSVFSSTLKVGSSQQFQVDASGNVQTSGTITSDSTITAATLSGKGEAPIGMVAFFTGSSCPTGWGVYTTATGRVVVAAGSGWSFQNTLGGAYANNSPKSHTHTCSGTTSNFGNNRNVRSDAHQTVVVGSHSHSFSCTTSAHTSSDIVPYIQLLACVRQS